MGVGAILIWDDTEDTKHISSGDQAYTWRESRRGRVWEREIGAGGGGFTFLFIDALLCKC